MIALILILTLAVFYYLITIINLNYLTTKRAFWICMIPFGGFVLFVRVMLKFAWDDIRKTYSELK